MGVHKPVAGQVSGQSSQEVGVSDASDEEVMCRRAEAFDFAATVDEFETPLLRYAVRIIGHVGHEVEDVVQEVFMRLHKQVTDKGVGSIGSVRVWLFRVAHNLAIDVGRKRTRRAKAGDRIRHNAEREQADSELAMDTLGQMERREAAEAAMAELDELPDSQRQVVLLKVVEGMTMREIAKVVGISPSNVCYRMNQGLRTVAKRLKETGVI